MKYFVDRRTGASRRHSMERMELMKLTPDKKGELPAGHGGARPKIPKVQKSMTVASETVIPKSQSVEVNVCYILSVLFHAVLGHFGPIQKAKKCLLFHNCLIIIHNCQISYGKIVKDLKI